MYYNCLSQSEVCLFTLLLVSFDEKLFLILMQCNLLMVIVFSVWLKNLIALCLHYEDNFLNYLLQDLLFSYFVFRSIRFLNVFWYIVWGKSQVSYIVHVDTNLTQHHLLKMPPFSSALQYHLCHKSSVCICVRVCFWTLNSVPLFHLSLCQ